MEHESDSLPSFTVKAKNVWSFASTVLGVVARQRCNCTLTLFCRVVLCHLIVGRLMLLMISVGFQVQHWWFSSGGVGWGASQLHNPAGDGYTLLLTLGLLGYTWTLPWIWFVPLVLFYYWKFISGYFCSRWTHDQDVVWILALNISWTLEIWRP